MSTVSILITTVLILINLLGFATVTADKYKARRKLWRIPEKTIFLIALLGGCIGIYSGMLIFRHKTRHWRFMAGIPAIFALQVILLYILIHSQHLPACR